MDTEKETLAKSLKNSGLAASMEDAIKKAEDILSGKNKGQNIRAKTKFDKPDFDIAKEERPLKEVVEEAEESPEKPIEEEKAEEVKEQIEEQKEEAEEKEKISVEELKEEPIEEQPEEEKSEEKKKETEAS